MGKTVPDGVDAIDASKFFTLLDGRLDERTAAWVAAAMAEASWRGGVARVLECTRMGRGELERARRELRDELVRRGRDVAELRVAYVIRVGRWPPQTGDRISQSAAPCKRENLHDSVDMVYYSVFSNLKRGD